MVSIPRVKAYYREKGFVLYQGDALEFLPKFPAETFDLIFADPPYRLSNDGFTCHAGRRVSVNKGEWDKSKGVEEDFDFHFSWIAACREPLKRNGSIWVSGTLHSIYQCGYALQLAGYKVLNDIAWYKPNAPPHLAARYFAHSHETLLWARKFRNAGHKFNYSLMKLKDWPEDFLKREGRQMRSVWAVNTPTPEEKKFGKHPTQKALLVLLRIVLACTDKGDLVLDPFTGSSTTGLACWLTGRSFVGIDTEEKYLELSIKRLKDIQKHGFHPNNTRRKLRMPREKPMAQKAGRTSDIESFIRELEEIRAKPDG